MYLFESGVRITRLEHIKKQSRCYHWSQLGLGRHIAEKIAAESCHLILLARD